MLWFVLVKQQEWSCAFQNQCSVVKFPHHQFHKRFMGCNDILLLFWSRRVNPTWQVVGTPKSSSLANNHQEFHMNTIGLEPKTFGCHKVPKGLVHILLTFVCVMETNLLSNQCRSIECTHGWCHQRFMGCNVIHSSVACGIGPSVTVTKKKELEREIWRNTDTTSQGTHADPNRVRAAWSSDLHQTPL
jgi:hypothetical protein